MFSIEEVMPEDMGTLAELTKLVRNLQRGRGLEIDKICPKMLKALNNVGLSWQTGLFSVTWRSRMMPVKWQTSRSGPPNGN